MSLQNEIKKNPFPRLMTPGPVAIHPEVLKLLALPAIHHRTPEFEEIFKRVLENLKAVFKTSQNVFIHTSTGSGAMESAIANCVSPGDKVICIVSGKFGERWAEMAKVYQANVITLSVDWGQAVQPEKLEKLLAEHPDCAAVLCQACETSTGVLHPIEKLGSIIAKTQALFLVDAITAIGATPLPMDCWQLDVVIGGSQKAFMLPTGLSFISFSKKAWAAVELTKSVRYYFDIRKELKANLSGESFFSSPVTHIRALDYILTNFMVKDFDLVLERIQNLALACRKACEIMGLTIYPKVSSPSLSVIQMPELVDGQKVRLAMEEKFNITVIGGQDALKGKVVRIGHMGYITNEDLQETLIGLAGSINLQKPHCISEEKIQLALSAAQKILK
jgi:aspartate aminotransferase-like enzyme